MSTIKNLAEEFGAQPYELREFAGDVIPDGLSDLDELPAEAESTIREAWAAAPNPDWGDQYTVEIQAGNGDDTIWQAMHPAETVTAVSARDAAWAVALNQNIAVGGNWRVAAWPGADADTGTAPAAVVEAGDQR